MHDCKNELHEVDLRATPRRLAILKLLETTISPIDATAIIAYLKKHNIVTNPTTVFRIINTFTNRGITKQIQLNEGKFRYELSTKAYHHHLICESCGSIDDVSDCNIDALEKDILKKKKFFVKHHSLEFFGLCNQCQR